MALLVLGVSHALAQQDPTLSKRLHLIHDAGQPRELEVALDEIFVGRKGDRGEVRPVRAATAEAVRRQAEALDQSGAEGAELVLYEAGKDRIEPNRRILTPLITTRLRNGADPRKLARQHHLVYRGPAPGGHHLFEATKTGGALKASEALRTEIEVEFAEPQLARQQTKRFTPNDPFFTQQWHLLNTGQSGGLAGTDVNLSSVWDTYRGNGIRIGIVDDGLQLTHPDLAPNVDSAVPTNHHDWNDSTADDPNPSLNKDFHGTACGGIVGARGHNSLGVSGAAPEATLVGMRLIAAATTDSQEAGAMSWKNEVIQVKTNSWGPFDDGKRLEGPGPLTAAALADATQNGRNGLGTIFVWAGGNGASSNDDANYDGYANSIHTIAVGAVDNKGNRASYSERGANLVVAAPSSGASGTLGIVTTDLVDSNGYNRPGVSGELPDDDYTNDFGGTSAAAPLAAGVVALILQANPNLGWRDVQEILMQSAFKVAPSHSDWITNGAGFHFNHDFGAGLVNTAAATALATTWQNLASAQSVTLAQTGLNVPIPDNNTAGIIRTFDFSASNLRTEHVTVRVSISHPYRGDLAITLTSPSGTESRLAGARADSNDNYAAWTFMTVRNWGEQSQGTWTLKIADVAAADVGTLTEATVTIRGTTLGPINQPPVIHSATITPGGTRYPDETLMLSGVVASDPEDDPITLAYAWQESSDNLNFAAIPGSTSPQLLLGESHSGKLVRCRITPSAAGETGAAFHTATVAVDHRPRVLAQHGQAYSYDSDLFVAPKISDIARTVIINEFSQGNGGNKEWIELLVLQQSNLSGLTVSDRSGTYTTFKTDGPWTNVAAGTVIVIYNAADRDSILPADNTNVASGLVIAPHNNATLFTAGTWGGLHNSSAESIIVRSSGGAVIDGVSFNNDNVYQPGLGSVGANSSARYIGDTDSGAELLANWVVPSTATAANATPGNGNGGANSQFVTDLRNGNINQMPMFRFGAGNEPVPGLTLNETSGVLSGAPNVPGGGFFQVVLERFTSEAVNSRTFQLLVLAADGSGTVPAGKTWSLTENAQLPGNLLVGGALDTNGHTLTVASGLLLSPTGSVTNTTGLIRYFHRTGAPLPGQTELIPDAVNDLLDLDGDGMNSLLEFALGTDPGVATPLGAPTVTRNEAGQLELTYSHPAGAIGVNRTVEVSGALNLWDTGPGFTEVVSDAPVDGVRTVVVRDLGMGGARYIRFKASR